MNNQCVWCSGEFNKEDKNNILKYKKNDYHYDCLINDMFSDKMAYNPYGVKELWITINNEGMYLDIWDKKEDAKKDLKNNIEAVKVVQGFGIIGESGYIVENTPDIVFVIEDVIQILEQLMEVQSEGDEEVIQPKSWKGIEVGDYVLINLKALQDKGWEGLHEDETESGKNYINYILENEDNIYTIKDISMNTTNEAPFILDDNFLEDTSFHKEELILIKEIVKKNKRKYKVVTIGVREGKVDNMLVSENETIGIKHAESLVRDYEFETKNNNREPFSQVVVIKQHDDGMNEIIWEE